MERVKGANGTALAASKNAVLIFDFWLTRRNLFGKLPRAASAPAAPSRDVTAFRLDAIQEPG
jgi:hypothetical protein